MVHSSVLNKRTHYGNPPAWQRPNNVAHSREAAVLTYSNYGLNLATGYYSGHDTNPDPTTITSGLNNNRFWYLGAKYLTLDGISMSASYSNGKNPARSNQADFSIYSAGLVYRTSSVPRVSVGVYYLDDRNNPANKLLEVAGSAEYSQSQTSLIYVQVGWVSNCGDMAQMIAYGQPAAPGLTTTAVMFGLHHNF